MFDDHGDITDQIVVTPKWCGENGVARCAEFAPRIARRTLTPCGWRCLIWTALSPCDGFSSGLGGAHRDENDAGLADQIPSEEFEDRDPPNYGDCPDGEASRCFQPRGASIWYCGTPRNSERNP